MPKLFGIEVDAEKYGIFEGVDDTKILMAINALRAKYGQGMRNQMEIQRFFLDEKGESNWTADEKKLGADNMYTLSEMEKNSILTELTNVRIQVDKGELQETVEKEMKRAKKIRADQSGDRKEAEKSEDQKGAEEVPEKKEENKVEEMKTEAKVEEKKAEDIKVEEVKTESKPEDQKITEEVIEKKEEKKVEEKREQKEAEKQPEAEKTDVNKAEVEKTNEKQAEEKKIDEKELKKEVVKNANAVAEKTNDVQKNLDKLANGEKAEPLTKEDLIKGMMAMQNGMLPQNQLLRYLQSLAEAKERNAQKNGALEDELLQDRRNTIKDIGDEYKAHREVTPDLVEKKEELGAIDNLLINVTKYPKVLFITLILMGLNPFLAIGLSVLAAFSKDMVQDIYKDLPEKDRSNLENKPAQKPQPVDNPQIEEYQKKLADAQQTMQERELAFRKLAQKSIIMRQMLQNMCSQMLQQAKNKMNKAEEKEKPKAEEKKPVSNEKEAGAVKNNVPEKQEVKKEKSGKTL